MERSDQLLKDNTSPAESTLKNRGIHEEWVDNYRTPENELFYRDAFAHIARVFGAPKGAKVLDAGCGSCTKSRNLVDQGFSVIGSDLSESALALAKEALRGTKYESMIDLRQENLTNLSFVANEFNYVVCWGVLMHVPDVASAISELCRVVAPNGKIAISEGNMHSWQARSLRLLKRILRKQRAQVIVSPAGVENWEETEDGRLMTRQANIQWVIREFAKHDMEIINHTAGQFSELYWVVPFRSVSKAIHWLNSIWFRSIRNPGPAFGNILIFRKKSAIP